MSDIIKIPLPKVRLSFPSLFKKSSFNGVEGKYEATFLLSKDDKDTYNKIIKKIELKLKAENKKVSKSNYFIKDGDEIFEEKEYQGYSNTYAIKASNNHRPKVLDKDNNPLLEEDNVIYSGCYVHAIISIWIQDNNFGKRVNANLLGLKFFKDGDRFNEGVSVADDEDFEDFENFEDDEDL